MSLLGRHSVSLEVRIHHLQAVLLSERLSGKGIVTALNMATGVPVWEIEPALGLLVGAFLAAGIYPVVRRLGARADAAREAKSSGTPSLADIPARKWGDSFQATTTLPLLNTFPPPQRSTMKDQGKPTQDLCVPNERV